MPKVVLLAGGYGTRFAEETDLRPKPMITIGEFPILWHIMKNFSQFGLSDFYIATGYKGEMIREYFSHYRDVTGSIMVDLQSGDVVNYTTPLESWKVHMIETGRNSMTGGRVLRLKNWIAGSGPFILTYGDGLVSMDMNALLRFHRSHGKIATLTAVHPPSRFGSMQFDGDRVTQFIEKPQFDESWINGGFMVFEDKVFDYLHHDSDSLEAQALETLAREGQLMAFKHHGFWQCMDSLRERRILEALWESGKAPWKNWTEP